jgi:hypothetical protein
MFLVLVLLVRRKLPDILSKLAERVTKAPGGWEFAALQQKVETLKSKVEQLERVTFEPSDALTPQLQARLQSDLDAFQTYVGTLGYQSQSGQVAVFVDPALKDNVYYDRNRIVLGQPLARDTDAVFREYTHHALLATCKSKWGDLGHDFQALESGLADYFPCSFNNDHLFGERSIHIFRHIPQLRDKQAIRDLLNNRKFGPESATAEIHDVGEVWGGLFWELRTRLGEGTVDKLLFSAWAALPPAVDGFDVNGEFVRKVLEMAGQNADMARAVFKKRGLKV